MALPSYDPTVDSRFPLGMMTSWRSKKKPNLLLRILWRALRDRTQESYQNWAQFPFLRPRSLLCFLEQDTPSQLFSQPRSFTGSPHFFLNHTKFVCNTYHQSLRKKSGHNHGMRVSSASPPPILNSFSIEQCFPALEQLMGKWRNHSCKIQLLNLDNSWNDFFQAVTCTIGFIQGLKQWSCDDEFHDCVMRESPHSF